MLWVKDDVRIWGANSFVGGAGIRFEGVTRLARSYSDSRRFDDQGLAELRRIELLVKKSVFVDFIAAKENL